MLRIYKAEFSKKVKNIAARTKKLYSYLKMHVVEKTKKVAWENNKDHPK